MAKGKVYTNCRVCGREIPEKDRYPAIGPGRVGYCSKACQPQKQEPVGKAPNAWGKKASWGEMKMDRISKKLMEFEDWEKPSPDPNKWNPAVIDLKALGLELLDWHNGQSSALYAVGSSLFAGRPVSSLSTDLFRRAISELGFDASNPEVQTLIKKLKYVLRDSDQYESKLREEITYKCAHCGTDCTGVYMCTSCGSEDIIPVYDVPSDTNFDESKLSEYSTTDLNASASNGAYPDTAGRQGSTTLAGWAAAFNVPVAPYGSNWATPSKIVFERDLPHGTAKWELFHLTDYAVTATVSGPAYVLMPRS